MAEGIASFEDFKKLDMRVALVEKAEKVKGTDKLLRLSLRLGAEKRQIVAGIADQYTADSVKGKKIVVVYNLAPRTVKGVESQGMLLAALETDGRLALLVPDREVADGARVE